MGRGSSVEIGAMNRRRPALDSPQPALPEYVLGDAIPRILHQNFMAGEAAIPSRVDSIRNGLRTANPSWMYSFWDAPRAEQFVRETYGSRVLARYLSIRPEYYAARSDLFRYLVLYAQGGIYFDMKSTCTAPLDSLARPGEKFLLLNTGVGGDFREFAGLGTGEYSQWVIVTVAGHPYLRRVIERVLDNIDRYRSWRDGVGFMGTLRTTGPIAYTLAIHGVQSDALHTEVIDPHSRGLVYSAFESHLSHRFVYGHRAHYSTLTSPLVDEPAVDRLLGKGVAALHAIPGFGPIAAALRPMRRRLRKMGPRRPT